ncbi:aspartate/glutamate racemase family protein [Lacrimispora sp.]|uniref:aspartate/glutamate racemase family protein n=1 Tax=Lacrimispora sp. TaxID=2719234 RepID=UPI00345FFA63
MKKIALVSVTLNAVNPMTRYLMQNAPDIEVRNYLDSQLLEHVRRDGKLTDASVGRMFHMLVQACVDGADGIILTCTIFSAHVNAFSQLLSVPIICPDGAMLDAVSKQSGKTAILCTFEGTVETTKNLYLSYCKKNGTSKQVDMIVVPGAYDAAEKGNMKLCNELILRMVEELDPEYDKIVLAQISMSEAINGYVAQHASVYTSPASAYQALTFLGV